MKKNELNVSVGQRIRKTRENMGYTRESFSELCDISDSFLSDIERGNKSLTTKTLFKICSASHISADYLIFGKDNTATDNSATDSVISIMNLLTEEQCSHAVNILIEYYRAIKDL